MSQQPNMSDLPEDLRRALSSLTTCEISDALIALELSKEVRLLEGIKMMVANGQGDQPGSGLDILGKAFTVKMVQVDEPVPDPPKGHHIDNAPRGSVMFIQGPPTDGPNALWGDLMSTAATARKLQGAIIDGRVRDIRGLREVGFPVFAKGTATFGQKGFARPEAQQVPIWFPQKYDPSPRVDFESPIGGIFGGQIHPGDLILADEDGILLFPRSWSEERLWEIARAGQEGKKTDERITEDLKAGRGVAESMARWRGK
ncbi:ribonuclease E inhibitor RraA/Dimethylmenaquinone methyltransferase [Filobasidium floriforme]|uniref:ribonuclease E inhibitor RraA/Dimethylmenaquinone methyltransferase n=1 Tax=Filobasidium floriforme TaxID=5210 RepID=UPI001E8E7ED1|nr:ribonuclease E inhibitor RraA/Dimethylmenaquinone methyltransferase [Filobasidium floriforme]KAH8089053.1 ribonuclease E inhibitor RraA/Dimethylmenaquinone methyltransferase [Filobasidium floriforme]